MMKVWIKLKLMVYEISSSDKKLLPPLSIKSTDQTEIEKSAFLHNDCFRNKIFDLFRN